MGGGDLNLKKSWHPLTFRNQERVWAAEQKAKDEARKLEILRKEKEEERQIEELQRVQEAAGLVKKRSERLEWMYSGAATSAKDDKEDFLLGKKRVDKILNQKPDTTQISGKPSDDIPIFTTSANAIHNERDLAAKIRADPLLIMKQKELERIKTLMENPLRLKTIQTPTVNHQLVAPEDDEETYHRSNQSHLQQEQKQQQHNRHRGDEHVDRDSRSKYSDNDRRRDSRDDRRRSRSRSPDRKEIDREESRQRGNSSSSRYSSSSSSSHHASSSRHSSSYSSSSYHDSSSHSRPYHRSDRDDLNRSLSGSEKSVRDANDYKRRQRGSEDRNGTAVADAEKVEQERKRKLEEMMQNAEWSEDLRSKKFAAHKAETEEEERRLRQSRRDISQRSLEVDEGPTFIDRINQEAYGSIATSSLEDRVKRSRATLQRTPAASQKFVDK